VFIEGVTALMYLLKETPLVPRQDNLVRLLQERATYQPHDLAYSFLMNGEVESARLTFRELEQKARLIGSILQEELKLTGKCVLLMYPPSLDFITAFFGCLYAGVIPVPAYPPRRNQSIDRLQTIINDCQAQDILTTTAIQNNLTTSLDSYPHLEALRWLPTDNLLSTSFTTNCEFPEIQEDSLAFLQYTSGSTGNPKGVMVTHGNLIHNEEMMARAFGHYEQEVVYASWLPLFHDMGLIGNVFQSLYLGVPCILMSPVDFLQKPVRWLEMISQYGATTSGAPNFAYDLCVRKVTPEQMEGLDLSRWSVAFNGSEPIRAETLARFAAKFAPCGFRPEAFYPCYGMAEATLFITGGQKKALPITTTVEEVALEENRVVVTTPREQGTKTVVGCGRLWMEQKLVIVNPDTLTPCRPDEVGEIWVAGESVTQGYWQKPVQTQDTFAAYLAGTEIGPFLRTGDLGFLREDGELFVTGRLKDVVIIRGKNHYPQDLEQTVQSCHQALKVDAGAAFAVDVAGEEKVVVVQEVERTYLRKINLGQMVENIRRALTVHHGVQVHEVVLIKPGSLPKTSSGKIQRFQCRLKFLGNRLDSLEGKSALLNIS
jgi:acyl-CoA synthetase (AMP-forming)/AMP-acid ligase II